VAYKPSPENREKPLALATGIVYGQEAFLLPKPVFLCEMKQIFTDRDRKIFRIAHSAGAGGFERPKNRTLFRFGGWTGEALCVWTFLPC